MSSFWRIVPGSEDKDYIRGVFKKYSGGEDIKEDIFSAEGGEKVGFVTEAKFIEYLLKMEEEAPDFEIYVGVTQWRRVKKESLTISPKNLKTLSG